MDLEWPDAIWNFGKFKKPDNDEKEFNRQYVQSLEKMDLEALSLVIDNLSPREALRLSQTSMIIQEKMKQDSTMQKKLNQVCMRVLRNPKPNEIKSTNNLCIRDRVQTGKLESVCHKTKACKIGVFSKQNRHDYVKKNGKEAENMIPNDTVMIDAFAFDNNNFEFGDNLQALEKIIIPESVTNIGEYAFEGRKDIKKIVIPKTLRFIQEQSFANTGLDEFIVPEKIIHIGEDAFYNCPNLHIIFEKYPPYEDFNLITAISDIDQPKQITLKMDFKDSIVIPSELKEVTSKIIIQRKN